MKTPIRTETVQLYERVYCAKEIMEVKFLALIRYLVTLFLINILRNNYKRILCILLPSFLMSSCITSYNFVVLEEPAFIYAKPKSVSMLKYEIPKGTKVFISKKKRKKHSKIKWNSYVGWTNSATYKSGFDDISESISSNYKPVTTDRYRYTNSNYKSKGGTVNVSGYRRKDGTYVRPHTRRAPSRR